MATVFLTGGIASGKSLVGRALESWGAERIDLDDVSREVLDGDGDCIAQVVAEFGSGVLEDPADLDPETGELAPWARISRPALARRAFADPASADLLEAIEIPYIKARLTDRLTALSCSSSRPEVQVVEVPLLDRVEDLLDLADEVLYVRCPQARRRLLAQGRGVDPDDFDDRAARQPSDDYLLHKATYVIENDGNKDDLVAEARRWWDAFAARGGADDGR